jgi:hypothetical protein
VLTAHLAYRPIKGHGQVGLPLIVTATSSEAPPRIWERLQVPMLAPPPEPRGVPALPSELMPDRWWEVAN